MTAHPARWALDVTADDSSWDWLPLAAERGGSTGCELPLLPDPIRTDCACTPGFAAYTLDSDPESVLVARHFTSSTLRDWGLESLVDDVSVTASELVTNAFRYGHLRSSDFARGRPIWLGLLHQGTSLICAVTDPGHEVPVLKEPDFLAESGRGLHVIEALSDAWGWTPPDRTGKVVWAMFSAPGGRLGSPGTHLCPERHGAP